MHDVGKLVLGLRLGASYWALLDDAAASSRDASSVELEAFGCHHATVGGWLLQLWQLPPALVDAVALHHGPLVREIGLDLPAIIGVADRLVHATDPSSGNAHPDIFTELRAFSADLLHPENWRTVYAGLIREQNAVRGLFDS